MLGAKGLGPMVAKISLLGSVGERNFISLLKDRAPPSYPKSLPSNLFGCGSNSSNKPTAAATAN